jgi:hypothetical protein
MNANLQISFGNLNNPFLVAMQTVSIGIQINSTRYAQMSTSIPSSLYSNMPININSIKQSDYSVGALNVSYIFNFSLTYIPNNPQLQLILPS